MTTTLTSRTLGAAAKVAETLEKSDLTPDEREVALALVVKWMNCGNWWKDMNVAPNPYPESAGEIP